MFLLPRLGRRATLLLCLAAIALTGCASRTPPLYHWGNFQDEQYAYLNGKKGPEDGIQELERIQQEASAKGKTVPPGFHAHLGMLYGLTGRTDLFERNLLAEQQQFPESSTYVDFLLKKKKTTTTKKQ